MGRRKRWGSGAETGRYDERLQDVFGGSIRALHRAVKDRPQLTSFETVRKIVRGERLPTDSQRQFLAVALGVEPEWLATGQAWVDRTRRHAARAEEAVQRQYHPTDVEITKDVAEPRRSAVLRFGQLLDATPPRRVRRGLQHTQVLQPFLHRREREPVIKAATRYLERAEDAVSVVPTGFAYAVWASGVLAGFAFTLLIDRSNTTSLEIARSDTPNPSSEAP